MIKEQNLEIEPGTSMKEGLEIEPGTSMEEGVIQKELWKLIKPEIKIQL